MPFFVFLVGTFYSYFALFYIPQPSLIFDTLSGGECYSRTNSQLKLDFDHVVKLGGKFNY